MTGNGENKNLPIWVTDFESTHPSSSIRPLSSKHETEEQFNHLFKVCDMIWIIENEDEDVTSYIGINNIDYKSRHVEMFVVSETEKEEYLKIGIEKVCEYCFFTQNMNRIHTRIFDDNPLTKIIEELDFEKEATLKKHNYKNGKYRDVLWYGRLRSTMENE